MQLQLASDKICQYAHLNLFTDKKTIYQPLQPQFVHKSVKNRKWDSTQNETRTFEMYVHGPFYILFKINKPVFG